MKLLLLFVIGFLSACSPNDSPKNSENNELWVMVKIDSQFRSQNDLKIIDLVANHIEDKELGFLDGHSSGAYQLDFNFVEIKNIEVARKEITKAINSAYPNVEYTISNTYEVKYEKL